MSAPFKFALLLAAGLGPGPAFDASTLTGIPDDEKTIAVTGPFDGSVTLEISNDGVNWSKTDINFDAADAAAVTRPLNAQWWRTFRYNGATSSGVGASMTITSGFDDSAGGSGTGNPVTTRRISLIAGANPVITAAVTDYALLIDRALGMGGGAVQLPAAPPVGTTLIVADGSTFGVAGSGFDVSNQQIIPGGTDKIFGISAPAALTLRYKGAAVVLQYDGAGQWLVTSARLETETFRVPACAVAGSYWNGTGWGVLGQAVPLKKAAPEFVVQALEIDTHTPAAMATNLRLRVTSDFVAAADFPTNLDATIAAAAQTAKVNGQAYLTVTERVVLYSPGTFTDFVDVIAQFLVF